MLIKVLSEPHMWSNIANHNAIKINQDCDCHCACPMMASNIQFNQAVVEWENRLHNGFVQQFTLLPQTYLLNIGSHTLAFAPDHTGLLVMDATVRRLIDNLPADIPSLQSHIDWPAATLHQVMGLLLAHGLVAPEGIELIPEFTEPEILVAWLHLTERCTLACRYCYAQRSNREMNPATAQGIVEATFRSAIKQGFKRVKIKYAGGEPTLNPAALWTAQRRAEELQAETGVDLETVLLTNGVDLSPQMIDDLIVHNVAVTVSLDGLGVYQRYQRPTLDGSDSFEAVHSSLQQLQARGVEPHVSVTITRFSLPGLPDLVAWLLDRDLRFSLNFYRPTDLAADTSELSPDPSELILGLRRTFKVIERDLPKISLLNRLLDRASLLTPHKHACGVKRNYLAFDVDGNTYPCQMAMDYAMGDFTNHDPLHQIQTDNAGIINLSVDERSECSTCPWRYYCAGGCPRLNQQTGGYHKARSPLCSVYRTLIPEVLRLEGLRLIRHTSPISLEKGAFHD
jgi:uncharacterized protein